MATENFPGKRPDHRESALLMSLVSGDAVRQIEVNAGVEGVAVPEPGGVLREMGGRRKHAGRRHDAVRRRLQDALADAIEVAVIVGVDDQARALGGRGHRRSAPGLARARRR